MNGKCGNFFYRSCSANAGRKCMILIMFIVILGSANIAKTLRSKNTKNDLHAHCTNNVKQTRQEIQNRKGQRNRQLGYSQAHQPTQTGP